MIQAEPSCSFRRRHLPFKIFFLIKVNLQCRNDSFPLTLRIVISDKPLKILVLLSVLWSKENLPNSKKIEGKPFKKERQTKDDVSTTAKPFKTFYPSVLASVCGYRPHHEKLLLDYLYISVPRICGCFISFPPSVKISCFN